MADQKREGRLTKEAYESQTNKSQTGDPGRTPGKAEGDRETVEQDLRDKENDKR
jgi:hypothetical protein